MRTQFNIALRFLLVMTVLTGIVYPVLITGIAQAVFPGKANGSIIRMNGKIIGSKLIGQKFDSSSYFWSRPSATDYNPVPSGASNFGPTSRNLVSLVDKRSKTFLTANTLQSTLSLPTEMLFASASGLDPHISVIAARLQVKRIAAARHFNKDQEQRVNDLIRKNTENRQFGILGEERINVFLLNIGLDEIK
jgi:potassium-transporting ATPase KdpC subunit